ncbi:Rrf2 family transcriptional regulator [Flavisolibacter sp. BT320]|jgi:Rrf2 family protein|nr:Rrf2 family transcriptional regulator [Flavisolibacter longurius]
MLNQKTKYALQALAYLANHYKDETPVLIGTIAREKNIPIKFLEAILCELRNHEILISIRGRNGGYRLAEAPKKIPLARIIRIVDGPIALLSCASLYFYKPCENCDEKICGISPIMKEARDAILRVLERRTLNDIRDREVEKLFA